MNDSLILYEDAELIVCHKPAGLPVQSARIGQKDMVSVLNNHLAQGQANAASARKTPNARNPRMTPSVYVVHRLDQPVEGVLVFAKTKRAAAALSRQVADGSMKKTYRAVCCAARGGNRDSGPGPGQGFGPEQGPGACQGFGSGQDFRPGQSCRLVDYLVRDGRTNTSSVVAKDCHDAKRAELVFHIAGSREAAQDGGETAGMYVLAEIMLETGRHHQIRVQMAHAGLPLYGDRKYNGSWQKYLTPSDKRILSGQSSGMIPLALCAVSLTFRHPVSGKEMTFEASPGPGVFSLFEPEKC